MRLPRTIRNIRLRRAYRWLAATDEGRLIIADLCEQAGIGRDAFVPGAGDVTAYGLGRQYMALRVLKLAHLRLVDALEMQGQHENDLKDEWSEDV